MTGDFSKTSWTPKFPKLTWLTLKLTQIPFPYCSLIALLFESSNLTHLMITLELINSVIQEFDEQDFNSRLHNHRLKLKEVGFINKHNPIIPFESLVNLLDASPSLDHMELSLIKNEEQILIEKYGLEIINGFIID